MVQYSLEIQYAHQSMHSKAQRPNYFCMALYQSCLHFHVTRGITYLLETSFPGIFWNTMTAPFSRCTLQNLRTTYKLIEIGAWNYLEMMPTSFSCRDLLPLSNRTCLGATAMYVLYFSIYANLASNHRLHYLNSVLYYCMRDNVIQNRLTTACQLL